MLKYIPHHLTKLCPKIGGAVTSKEQLPAGIRRTPQGLQVDMEKLKPGMRPVKVVSPNGVTYIDESCARSETNTGDVHWHWRDGRLESQMRRFSRIALHSDVAVARRERVQLVNGHVLNGEDDRRRVLWSEGANFQRRGNDCAGGSPRLNAHYSGSANGAMGRLCSKSGRRGSICSTACEPPPMTT